MEDGYLASIGQSSNSGRTSMSKKTGTGKQAGGNNIGMQGIKKLSQDTNKLSPSDPAGIMAAGRQSAVKPTSQVGSRKIRGTKAR